MQVYAGLYGLNGKRPIEDLLQIADSRIAANAHYFSEQRRAGEQLILPGFPPNLVGALEPNKVGPLLGPLLYTSASLKHELIVLSDGILESRVRDGKDSPAHERMAYEIFEDFLQEAKEIDWSDEERFKEMEKSYERDSSFIFALLNQQLALQGMAAIRQVTRFGRILEKLE